MKYKNIKKILYQDTKDVLAFDNQEIFVQANHFNKDIVLFLDTPIEKSSPNTIIFGVRETVAKKLALISHILKQQKKKLAIGYGFRPLEIQTKVFNEVYKSIKKENKNLAEEALIEKVYQLIAIPHVAGHPTGGAVDVTLISDEGDVLDMGTPFLDINHDPKEISCYAENLTHEQKNNRESLFQVMTEQGFAPMWGEWWHFSYGDTEWAAYYQKPSAIFSQKKLLDLNLNKNENT